MVFPTSKKYFVLRDKKIENLFDRLLQTPPMWKSIEIDRKTAFKLAKYKEIRYLRKKGLCYIAPDNYSGKSIVYFKTPFEKKKKKIFFKL